MEDKVIETITYKKSVSKKKPSIDRIKIRLLKICDENVWSIEDLPNLLQDMCNKSLIDLILTKSNKHEKLNWLKRL